MPKKHREYHKKRYSNTVRVAGLSGQVVWLRFKRVIHRSSNKIRKMQILFSPNKFIYDSASTIIQNLCVQIIQYYCLGEAVKNLVSIEVRLF